MLGTTLLYISTVLSLIFSVKTKISGFVFYTSNTLKDLFINCQQDHLGTAHG